MAERALNSGGHLSGLTTGLEALNSKIGGLHRSDLVIVAGRPGMGKTSLATNIAYNVARAYESELQADGTVNLDAPAPRNELEDQIRTSRT